MSFEAARVALKAVDETRLGRDYELAEHVSHIANHMAYACLCYVL